MIRFFRRVDIEVLGDGTSSSVKIDLRDSSPRDGLPLSSPPNSAEGDPIGPPIDSIAVTGYIATLVFPTPPPIVDSSYTLRLFYEK